MKKLQAQAFRPPVKDGRQSWLPVCPCRGTSRQQTRGRTAPRPARPVRAGGGERRNALRPLAWAGRRSQTSFALGYHLPGLQPYELSSDLSVAEADPFVA